jgi:predicted amidophosphoribosyltransferase
VWRVLDGWLDAGLDLALGSSCSVCATPGRALCRRCAHALPARAAACWPTPTPPGLVRPSAVGDYAPPLQPLVVDHKDGGRLALARPLGRLLAMSVLDAWEAHLAVPPQADAGWPQPARLGLVPVPSHPAVVRRRGHDPVLAMSRHAAAWLRSAGIPASVLPLLRVTSRPDDQAGLGAEARAANVHGRFAVRARSVRLLRSRGTGGRVARPQAVLVLVDDVITTGATLREAQRALEAEGLRPAGAAAVAATRRRHPSP